jgi:hypothetical protein
MEAASSPDTGVAREASLAVAGFAVAWASPGTMTFVAGRSAGELSPGTISGAARLADKTLREITAFVAARKERDP